jgi:hypothetical protein
MNTFSRCTIIIIVGTIVGSAIMLLCAHAVLFNQVMEDHQPTMIEIMKGE